MSTEGTPKKSNTGLMVLGMVIVLAFIGGAVYLFSKSGKPAQESTTATTTTSNSGLSGLLAGLNLSGLHILG